MALGRQRSRAGAVFSAGTLRRVLARGVLALVVASPVARGDTLLEVYALALKSDPKFKAAQAEAGAAGTATDQAQAGFLPTVRFEREHTQSRQRILSSENPVFSTGSSHFPTDNKTLYVTQPIFRKDVIERYEQAKAVVRQAEFTLLAAEQDLILRTTSAYLLVLAAADNLALAVAEREAVGKALELARERLKGGLGTITNQYDAAARFAVAQAREIEARNKLRDARQGLREITGRTIDTMQTLRTAFPLETPDPAAVDRWVDAALEQNLLLRARREAVIVARQEVERQRAGHFPSVNLLLTHNKRDTGSTLFGGGSNIETTDLMVRLTVPIFEGGLVVAVTQEAAFRYQKSQEELEQEARSVDRVTRAAYDATLSGVGLVRALGESVVAQEGALAAKEQGYRAGLFTLLPVLDAQRDLYLVKRDYYQTRYEYLVNRLRLKQAAGTLAESDLVSVGAALQ
jgi:outer membrane protein